MKILAEIEKKNERKKRIQIMCNAHETLDGTIVSQKKNKEKIILILILLIIINKNNNNDNNNNK